MPLTLPSYDEIEAQALAFFRNRLPGKDTHTESFLGKVSRALARTLNGFHLSVQTTDNNSVPSKSTSTDGLDRWASSLGLPDGAGGYGRKKATAASGGAALCSGTKGITFLDGTQLLAPDGVTVIQLSGNVTIPGTPPGTGTEPGSFFAVTTGTAGNLAVGSVLSWINPPVGAQSTVTLTTALSGAIDTETNDALLGRILDRLQIPPKGGTASDYRRWAESVAGVFRAYVYPLRGGTGTVHVLVAASGTGQDRAPTTAVRDAVSAYIAGNTSQEGQRPVTVAGYKTLLPNMPTGNGLALRVRLTPSLAKYAFDWSLGASAFTVASYAAGSPGVITMNQSLPASLTAAIDAGAKPRLQVVATGMTNPIPVLVHVVSYVAVAKTLTLEDPLPAGWTTPTAGDAVYPGGPVVEQTATDLLAYVAGLGPSRLSGYANPLDPWEDTCAVFRMAQVALDSKDADGTKFSRNAIASTINGSATDVQAGDSAADSPDMLFATSIAVTD